MYQLPLSETRRWTQTNGSDRFGTLQSTRNVVFDEDGYLKLNKRPRCLIDSGNTTTFGSVFSIQYHAGSTKYYILTSGGVFFSNTELTSFTLDNTTNAPTTFASEPDMCPFNGYLYVAAGITNDLRRMDSAGAWSTSVYSLSGGSQYPMCVFENRNELAIGDGGNTVITLNTSHVLQQTLTLPDDYNVVSMAWANNKLYIGTRHDFNGNAILFEWDGTSASANNGYPVSSTYIQSVISYDGSVAIVTGGGQLLYFTGGSFLELGSFPQYHADKVTSLNGGSVLSQYVCHRGMMSHEGRIYINIRGAFKGSDNDVFEPIGDSLSLSGVWCYDPKVGLYHYAGVSGDIQWGTTTVATTDVNTTTDVITLSAADTWFGTANVPDTGTPVLYDDGANGSGSKITPLKHRTKYYVIKTAALTFKLATTYANAIAGTAIDLTATGNNAQYFVMARNRDYGQTYTSVFGAIQKMLSSTPQRSDASTILFGGRVGPTIVGTQKDVLCTLTDLQENRGSATTAKLGASVISDVFQNVTVKFKNIATAEDVIVVKYRIIERDDKLKVRDSNRTLTATWSDVNTFTTTADLSLAEVGEEVELVGGVGGGMLAHISSISEAGGTYTVTIDEDLQNISASDTSLFYIDTWQKLGTITSADCTVFVNANSDTITGHGGSKTFAIGKQSEWAQVKLELRGKGTVVEDILLNNKPFKTFVS